VVKDPAQDTFVEKLIANVIKNLEVTVTNIHVRFEDNVTNPKKPFSVGVTLRELSLRVSLVIVIYAMLHILHTHCDTRCSQPCHWLVDLSCICGVVNQLD